MSGDQGLSGSHGMIIIVGSWSWVRSVSTPYGKMASGFRHVYGSVRPVDVNKMQRDWRKSTDGGTDGRDFWIAWTWIREQSRLK
jgi:hypothetical protein